MHIRKLAIANASIDSLRSVAWISWDPDGMKTIDDCTTYDNGNHFLQCLAQLFLNPEGRTRRWLKDKLQIDVLPVTAGGDEFAMLLRGKAPITPELIEKIIASYQQEIAEHAPLGAHLDLNDPKFLKRFAIRSEAQRREFEHLPLPEQKRRLQIIFNKLSENGKGFVPTVPAGGKTLDQAVNDALESGALSLGNGDTSYRDGRDAITNNLITGAEDVQKKNKAEEKLGFLKTNPRHLYLITRTEESRRLLTEIEAIAKNLTEALAGKEVAEQKVVLLEKEISTLRARFATVLESEATEKEAEKARESQNPDRRIIEERLRTIAESA